MEQGTSTNGTRHSQVPIVDWYRHHTRTGYGILLFRLHRYHPQSNHRSQIWYQVDHYVSLFDGKFFPLRIASSPRVHHVLSKHYHRYPFDLRIRGDLILLYVSTVFYTTIASTSSVLYNFFTTPRLQHSQACAASLRWIRWLNSVSFVAAARLHWWSPSSSSSS